MKSMFWLVVLVAVAAAVWVVARIRRTIKERERAEEERAAGLLSEISEQARAAAEAQKKKRVTG